MAGKKVTSRSKKHVAKTAAEDVSKLCNRHYFTDAEVFNLRDQLFMWYDKEQRKLPWRTIAKTELDPNKKGYAVWVSEVMLQQTQVATVIAYFNKWMQKWPDIESLAFASLEEVNQTWAGLGYYSRARRLHEGANIIVKELNGKMPQTVPDLMKLIPGIGQYSASAIASVAFQKVAGVVDGNVIRVLSRMRQIGGHVSQMGVRDHLWLLANKIVSESRPGDFNQALMELGATVCTSQNPKCGNCPVNTLCGVYLRKKQSSDAGKLESFLNAKSNEACKKSKLKNSLPVIKNVEECHLCLPLEVWRENPDVTVYPCKVEKKKSRVENVGVVVIKRGDKFLMTKRPEKGLLAGLWEFPSIIFSEKSDSNVKRKAIESLLYDFGFSKSDMASRKYVSEVVHLFSHIRTTYIIEYLLLEDSVKPKDVPLNLLWLTPEEIKTAAVSTAMKKVLNAVKSASNENVSPKNEVPKCKRRKTNKDSKQSTIKAYFS